jgi:hypothetical protein
MNWVAFGLLFSLVLLTSVVILFLAYEEGKLRTQAAIIVVAAYALIVLLVEFYRTWAHTMRVKSIMEAAHKLQESLADSFTNQKQAAKVGMRATTRLRQRTAYRVLRLTAPWRPLSVLSAFSRLSAPRTVSSSTSQRYRCPSLLRACAPARPRARKGHVVACQHTRCPQVLAFPEVLRRLHAASSGPANRLLALFLLAGTRWPDPRTPRSCRAGRVARAQICLCWPRASARPGAGCRRGARPWPRRTMARMRTARSDSSSVSPSRAVQGHSTGVCQARPRHAVPHVFGFDPFCCKTLSRSAPRPARLAKLCLPLGRGRD